MIPELYAHRGGSGFYAENTLAAFSHAIDLGCAGAELDVHLSRDGVVVVHHDERLNPAFCRQPDGRYVAEADRACLADLSLAELRRFTLGEPNPALRTPEQWPHLRPVVDQRMPTLEEVMQLAQRKSDNFRLLIEIKTDLFATGQSWQLLVDKVLQVADAQGFTERISICSFNWQALRYVQQCNTQIPRWFTLHPLSWYGLGAVPAGDIPPSAAYLQRFRTAWQAGAPWLDGYKPAQPEQLPAAVARVRGDVVFAYHTDLARLDTALDIGLWSVNVQVTDLAPLQRARYLCLDYPFLHQK